MADNARLRWTLLLSTLGLTVGAVFYPTEDAVTTGASASATRLAPGAKALVKVVGEPVGESDEKSGGSDPFAPRGWVAPPPPAPPSAPAVATLAVSPVDLTPAGPPELPFRFVGSLNDGTDQTVYLARGEQSYIVRVGETIETNYKMIGVTTTQIEFEHIPTGARQVLVLPARDN